MLYLQVNFTFAFPVGTNFNMVLSTRRDRHSWHKLEKAGVETRDLPADVEFAGSQLWRDLYSLSARATQVPRVRVSSSDSILASAHLLLEFIFSVSLKNVLMQWHHIKS